MQSRRISKSKNIVWFGKDMEEPTQTYVEFDGVGQKLDRLPQDNQIEIDGVTYDLVFAENSKINGYLYDGEDLKGKFTLTTPSVSNYETGADGVADSLIQALSVIKGELWYRLNYGLPLFDKIRGTALLDMEILAIITNTPGVSTVSSFSSSVKNHTYTFSCQIQSIYGESFELTNSYVA